MALVCPQPPPLLESLPPQGRAGAEGRGSPRPQLRVSVTTGWLPQGNRGLGRRGRQLVAGLRACGQSPPLSPRPEAQDPDGAPQCPGRAGGKPEEGEEEEELEEDDDSLAGKSQEDTASPTPEPQGPYEDEEEDDPPTALAVGFDRPRRCVLGSAGRRWGGWGPSWGGGREGSWPPAAGSPPHSLRVTSLQASLPQGLCPWPG